MFGGNWILRVKKFSPNNYFKCVTSHTNLTSGTGPSILPNGESNYMYIETSCNNHSDDENNYCPWTTHQFHNITKISFQYNRYSTTHKKWMGSLTIKLLTKDNSWNTVLTLNKNDNYTLADEWKQINIDITFKNYGIEFLYDSIKIPQSDMAFSNIILQYTT